MIDNATRAAWDAIEGSRFTLRRIQDAAQTLADELDPDTEAAADLYALAGDAWQHLANERDIIEAGVLDGQLPAAEVRAWLEQAVQIIDRARQALP